MAGAVKVGSRPPWVGLGAAVWVQVAAGSGYNFPLYSPALKAVLGFSQQQLTMLGVANDVGENFGMVPGVLCNRLPPSLVLLIGAAASFLGYGLIWLAVSQTLPSIPYWLCRQRFNHSFVAHDTPQIFAAMSPYEPGEEVWYPDTGTSNHMTANSGILSSSKPYSGHEKILVGNKNLLEITQTGETQLHSSSKSFDLKNVHVVPSIKKNLLSVRQFCHHNHSVFEFDSSGFLVKDKETGKELLRCPS